MSISSAMSGMSINSRAGEEVDLETHVVETFKSIQGHLNNTHCKICELAQVEERGEGYRYSYPIQRDIEYSLNTMTDLFKELKSIVKQLKLNPVNQADKDWKLSYDVEFANRVK